MIDSGTVSLYAGAYQDTPLAQFPCDALISDPPYGAGVHEQNESTVKLKRKNISYAHWTPEDVLGFVEFFAPRTHGWMACLTSDDLIPAYRAAYRKAGRKDFAPVPVLQHRPRLCGDGPGSGTVYLMVARPRERRFQKWGSLPCWYQPARELTDFPGAKPLLLMQAIVRDYSRPGDIVFDPCAGTGTTLLAAAIEGRRACGAESDPKTFDRALRRIRRGHTPNLPLMERQPPQQLTFT